MIVRFDRLAAELPPPSTPDPDGASVVQELMGGKFGELSTFMNYTFQSFNFRDRQKARPFYDLIANIAAEEFGHIEVVAATINSMLTGVSTSSNEPDPTDRPLEGAQSFRNTRQWISGGLRRSRRTPTATRGPGSSSTRRATWSRTSCTTTSSSRAPGARSCASTRRSTTPPRAR
jgi:Mn-containing catalase